MPIIKLALITELLCDVCSFVIDLYHLTKFLSCNKKCEKHFLHPSNMYGLGNHSSMHTDALYIYVGLLIHKSHLT